jgi:hypothetical protein
MFDSVTWNEPLRSVARTDDSTDEFTDDSRQRKNGEFCQLKQTLNMADISGLALCRRETPL